MKKNTELVFVLDRSGSMSGLEKDTIGGFNGLIKKQKKEPGQARVTTVLFDDSYELLHDRVKLSEVDKMTEDDYYVGGSTALLDALGRTIASIDKAQKKKEADSVLFVIITDGQENASHEFRPEKIKKLIKSRIDKKGWEFLFLGANIDAVKTAGHYGISKERAANFHADKQGSALNFSAINEAVCEMRSSYQIDNNWKKKIDHDYKSRKKQSV